MTESAEDCKRYAEDCKRYIFFDFEFDQIRQQRRVFQSNAKSLLYGLLTQVT